MKNEKIKLFLVDDDVFFLKSLEIDFLQRADFSIETYVTGELCLENLSQKVKQPLCVCKKSLPPFSSIKNWKKN